ncbi:ferritin-like domain-containing protein [Oceanithermus sp.]
MKKNTNTKRNPILMTLAAGALLLGLAFAQMGGGPQAAQQPTTPLTEEAKTALYYALTGPEGEYAAYAMYSAVIEKYGAVEPYVSIQQAEAKHIAALQRQLDAYGIAYPENPYLGKVPAPESLEDAAKAWAEGEVNNVAMYDELMPLVADYPNLVQVFTNLRAASENMHLPAFQLAAENGGTLTPEQMQELQQKTGHTHGAGGQGAGGQGNCNHTAPAPATTN